ncbi:hypothetical protein QQF64_035775 [Cirrhinus molitorella]|uniref:Uncharacterized protein n=2 Tax=Cirrhinus molitorella TaxID=172907 RepID=A0AA88PYI1_9TELE|nr:hypothetical protein Q8A67_012510 [Cirrhinus molitorella]
MKKGQSVQTRRKMALIKVESEDMKTEETFRIKCEDTEEQTAFRVKHEDTEEQTKTAFIKDESEDMRIEETFSVKHESTEEQTVKTAGSTVRQCPHCRNKMNCRNRRCVKCGKLLDFKHRQSVRLAKFRAQAQQWANTTIKSRNQSKVLDNLTVMMEKLKALGYVPLLLLGKCSKAQKWTAEVQCPLEFPPEGHDVMEKMLILFEQILKANQLSTWQQKESPKKDGRRTNISGQKRTWQQVRIKKKNNFQAALKKKACMSGTDGGPPTQDFTAEELNKEKPVMEGIQGETSTDSGPAREVSDNTLLEPPDSDPREGTSAAMEYTFADDETVLLDSRRFEDPDSEQPDVQHDNINSQTVRPLYIMHLKRQIELAEVKIEVNKRKLKDIDPELEIKRKTLRKLDLEIQKLERDLSDYT